MNKRGVVAALYTAMEFALLIMIIIGFSLVILRAPHEERINELKAIDLGLALDTVSAMKGDVFLNYDLGGGMSVKVVDGRLKMYRKRDTKAVEEIFSGNMNYEFEGLSEKRYGKLYVVKAEGKFRVSGFVGFEEESKIFGFGGLR